MRCRRVIIPGGQETAMAERVSIAPARGRLGVLIPGLGSVASTFIAGVLLARKHLALPIGSLTQLQKLRLGKRTSPREVAIKDLVPLARLDDMVFGGWDPVETNAYDAAVSADVVPRDLLDKVKDELKAVEAWPAAFREDAVKLLKPRRTKKGGHLALVEQLREDIRKFKQTSGADRLVMCLVASTEAHLEPTDALASRANLEKALEKNDPSIRPSLLYAYAALQEGVPFVNGTPNVSSDAPAITELAIEQRLPIAGKDLKTGQT